MNLTMKQKLVWFVSILLTSLWWLGALPGVAHAEPRILYNIASFGCDWMHDNFGTLYPDGQPVCGTGNCPGPPARPPGGCWAQHVVMRAPQSGNEAGVWWNYNDKGQLRLGVAQDHHIIAWTWVWVRQDKVITLNYGIDSGGAFVTSVATQEFTVLTSGTAQLRKGWNLLEFTGYHQHDSTSGGMPDNLDLAGQVDFINHEPVKFKLDVDRFPIQFVVDKDEPGNPPAQTVTIRETNGANFAWTADPLCDWVSIAPVSGTTPTTVQVSIDRSKMPSPDPGTYECAIFIATTPEIDSIANVNEVGLKVSVKVTQRPPEPDIDVGHPPPDLCPQVPLGESAIWPEPPSADNDHPSTLFFTISNKGKADLIIYRIESSDPLTFRPLDAENVIISPGTGRRFDVLLTPQQPGKTNGTLTIHSNDPDAPTRSVSICVEGLQFFENVTSPAGIPGTGNRAIWGDYDKDGWLDLYVVKSGPNVLYHNNGNGTFTPVTAGVEDGGDSTDAAWGDYNNDGRLDLLVVNNQSSDVLYQNHGGVTFTPIPLQDVFDGRSCAFLDYNCDGWLDFIIVNEVAPSQLYRNKGDGMFEPPVSFNDGGSKKDVAVGDYNNDGFPDVYIVKNGANVLYRNTGDGSPNPFIPVAAQVEHTGPGIAAQFGDYDNDGWLDIYLVNVNAPNVMYHNNRVGGFEDKTVDLGVGYNGSGQDVAFGDYDNGGSLDIFVVNSSGRNVLYRNNLDLMDTPNLSFTDVTDLAGVGTPTGRGAAWGDYDNEGRQDLYLASNTTNALFRNRGSSENQWVKFVLEGAVTNRAGLGARLVAFVDGRTLTREFTTTWNTSILAFGLGKASWVDWLAVSWPSRRQQTLFNRVGEQSYPIPEPGIMADFTADVTSAAAPLPVQFLDLSDSKLVKWQWEFGDSTTSTEENPKHTYTLAGIYKVRLTVTDQFGQSDTVEKEKYIDVKNVISVPDVYAPVGGRFTIPVSLADTTFVTSVHIPILYDQTWLNLDTEIAPCGVKPAPGAPIRNPPVVICTTPGELRIQIDLTEAAYSGPLVYVCFKVLPGVQCALPWQTSLVDIDSSRLSLFRSIIDPVSNEAHDGLVTFARFGDVNADCQLNSADVILILRTAVDRHKPSLYQQWAADPNQDDEVNSGDAVCVLRAIVGLDKCPPDIPPAAPGLVAQTSEPITVSIPSMEVPAGGSVAIPVQVAHGTGLAGGDVVLTFDPNLVTVTDVLPSPLTKGFLLVANTTRPGQVKVSIARATPLKDDADGALFIVTAKLNADAKVDRSTPLTVAIAKFFADAIHTLPATLQHGKLTVTDAVSGLGDVNGDKIVDASDAVPVLQHVAGKSLLNTAQQAVAQVNVDAEITAYDASLILQRAAGTLAQFPIETPQVALNPDPIGAQPSEPGTQYRLTMAHHRAKPGTRFTLPMTLNPMSDMRSGQLKLTYDPTQIELLTIDTGDAMKDYTFIEHREAHAIHLAFATAEASAGQGASFALEFLVRPDATIGEIVPLRLENVRINGESPVTVEHGSLEVLPLVSKLLPNYPNPFNPETWLPYQLASDANVTIHIYDVTGKLVRELVIGDMPAGSYMTRTKAAHWDGRNRYGEATASGVYFYTLQAGRFAAVRKMLLLK